MGLALYNDLTSKVSRSVHFGEMRDWPSQCPAYQEGFSSGPHFEISNLGCPGLSFNKFQELIGGPGRRTLLRPHRHYLPLGLR